MKLLINWLKRISLGIFSIYSFNLLFGILKIVIPFNLFTILISSLLGLFGVFSLAFIDFLI